MVKNKGALLFLAVVSLILKGVVMINKWLFTSKLMEKPRNLAGWVLHECYRQNNITAILFKNTGKDGEIFRLIAQVRKEVPLLQGDFASYFLYTLVGLTSKVQGDIAEVGVYKGATAKIICEASNKPVHLFDTFEGLPELSEYDDPTILKAGVTYAAIEDVRKYLKKYNVHFYKGLFPTTVEPVKDKTFSFVHLDVDLYEGTLECLKFFYPRLNKGGVLISHDYVICKGVKKAFDEFLADKPEIVFVLPSGQQCMMVKL